MPGAARRSKERESRPCLLRAAGPGNATGRPGLGGPRAKQRPRCSTRRRRGDARATPAVGTPPPPPPGCPERSAAVILPVKAARLPYSASDFTPTKTSQLFFIFFSFFFVSLAKHRRRENRINRRGNNCVAAHAHRGKEEKHLQVR